mmetsp:Transcript_25567/g.43566  ORF Transcript_25567/g.43566 Transcript_25567/m.43566 type:complete len:371 (+) Transcript_25567:2056-3168(+)
MCSNLNGDQTMTPTALGGHPIHFLQEAGVDEWGLQQHLHHTVVVSAAGVVHGGAAVDVHGIDLRPVPHQQLRHPLGVVVSSLAQAVQRSGSKMVAKVDIQSGVLQKRCYHFHLSLQQDGVVEHRAVVILRVQVGPWVAQQHLHELRVLAIRQGSDLCTIDYVQVDAWLLQQGRYELMAAFVARQMQWSAHDFPTTQPTCHPGAPVQELIAVVQHPLHVLPLQEHVEDLRIAGHACQMQNCVQAQRAACQLHLGVAQQATQHFHLAVPDGIVQRSPVLIVPDMNIDLWMGQEQLSSLHTSLCAHQVQRALSKVCRPGLAIDMDVRLSHKSRNAAHMSFLTRIVQRSHVLQISLVDKDPVMLEQNSQKFRVP